jgi:hypothetical protein
MSKERQSRNSRFSARSARTTLLRWVFLVAGRAFTAQDVGPAKYAVINESFAREYLPGRNPIGQRFGLVDDIEPVSPDIEVIGLRRSLFRC